MKVPNDIQERVSKIEQRARCTFGVDNYTISVNLFTDGDSHVRAIHNIDSVRKFIIHEGKESLSYVNDNEEY
jgi:hypothetical protein